MLLGVYPCRSLPSPPACGQQEGEHGRGREGKPRQTCPSRRMREPRRASSLCLCPLLSRAAGPHPPLLLHQCSLVDSHLISHTHQIDTKTSRTPQICTHTPHRLLCEHPSSPLMPSPPENGGVNPQRPLYKQHTWCPSQSRALVSPGEVSGTASPAGGPALASQTPLSQLADGNVLGDVFASTT